MANRFRDYRSDSSRSFINIDNLLRVFSSAEKSAGLPETFKEIKMDEPDTPKKCQTCQSKECETPKEKKLTPFACGNFDMSLTGMDFEDEDDGLYVCDMCDRLGYSGKYIPEICDTCKACAGCNEYTEEECSGCSYSIYRDGEYYHDKLPESELISDKDLQLFEDLNKTHPRRMKRNDGVGKFRNR